MIMCVRSLRGHTLTLHRYHTFLVAENVIGKKSINYKGNTFEVSMKIEGKVEESDITQDDTTVVEVRGIDGLSEDDLELVFENRKISSGGEILKIDLDDNNDCAYIQFKNSKGMSKKNDVKNILLKVSGPRVQTFCIVKDSHMYAILRENTFK